MRYITGLLALIVFLLFTGESLYSYEGDTATYSFQSNRRVGQIDQVNTVVEVKGEVTKRVDSRADPKGEKTEKVDLNVVCNRDYDEKTLEMPSGPGKRWRSVRYYQRAEGVVKEGKATTKPALRPDRRLIGVETTLVRITPFSPGGPLNDDDLEVLNTVGGNSIPLDGLLPGTPVAVGQKWKPSNEILALLADLEEITSSTVEIVLKEVTADVARLELSGRLDGKCYGAANQIELKAKCRFDRKTERIDWFAMRVKQQREIGPIEAGLDVAVLLQMKISPKAASEALSDAALNGVALVPTDALCAVEYESPEGGWRLLHDRLWFQVDHYRDLDVFQRMDHGQEIALCKISPLAKVDLAKRVPLAQFRDDVRQALGNNFGEFLDASELTNGANYRVLRVIVKGSDGKVPARWEYYHVSDDLGRQTAFAFRMEETRVEEFGKAGGQLVDSLRFGPASK